MHPINSFHRPFDLILSLYTLLTPFKIIWPEFYHCIPYWLLSKPFGPNFIIVYQNDSFQDHMICFSYHWVPNLLLSTAFDLILWLCTHWTHFRTKWHWFISLFTQLTPFKTIWPATFSLCTQLTPFMTIWSDFYHWAPNWLLSRPFDLLLSLGTQLSPFKIIWPFLIIVYPINSFQDHLTWFYYCVPN